MTVFAERARQRTIQLGLSNDEVARRAGIQERAYGHYVTVRSTGKTSEPDFATMLRICEVLQTHPNYLLGVSNDVVLAEDPLITDLLSVVRRLMAKI